MKTLMRAAAILAATLFVVGGAFAIVQSTGSSLAASGTERGLPSDTAAFAPPAGETATADTGNALETHRDGGREAGGVSGWINIAKNAAVMAGITLVVMLGGLGWRKARDLRRGPSAPLATPNRPAVDTSA